MNVTINNPIKNVKLNFSSDEVIKALKYVDKSSPNFSLKEENSILKSFKFGNRDGLSMWGEGNIIDVNVEDLENGKTNLVIEGSRMIGSINSSAEIMAVKGGMDEILEVISKLVGKDNIDEAAKESFNSFKETKSLYNYLASFMKWSFYAFLILISGLLIYAFTAVALGYDLQ